MTHKNGAESNGKADQVDSQGRKERLEWSVGDMADNLRDEVAANGVQCEDDNHEPWRTCPAKDGHNCNSADHRHDSDPEKVKEHVGNHLRRSAHAVGVLQRTCVAASLNGRVYDEKGRIRGLDECDEERKDPCPGLSSLSSRLAVYSCLFSLVLKNHE